MLPSALHLVSESSAAAPLLLVGSIAVVSVATAGVMIGCRQSRWKAAKWVPWLGCGGLIGAGLIGPLRIAPYILVATFVFAAVAAMSGVGGIRGMLTRAGAVLTGVIVSFACLWPFTLGRHRPIAHESYLSTELRSHTLLAGIPLHDVWIAHLSGGGQGRTLRDLNTAMADGVTGDETVVLMATLAMYELVARVLGLAREECVNTASSIAQRLTETDRQRSIYPPGEHGVVYCFEREALLEIRTCVAHAFYVFALEPEEGGYSLYWGAYANRVSPLTPYYMRLIDPVRRLVVYPSVLQLIEHRWRATWRAPPRGSAL